MSSGLEKEGGSGIVNNQTLHSKVAGLVLAKNDNEKSKLVKVGGSKAIALPLAKVTGISNNTPEKKKPAAGRKSATVGIQVPIGNSIPSSATFTSYSANVLSPTLLGTNISKDSAKGGYPSHNKCCSRSNHLSRQALGGKPIPKQTRHWRGHGHLVYTSLRGRVRVSRAFIHTSLLRGRI